MNADTAHAMHHRTWIAVAAFAVVACGGESPRENGTPPAGTPTATVAGGEQLYQQRCASCHQANGQGIPGTFPPLAGSEYANAANVAVPIMVVIYGMHGPVTVHGAQYDGLMPPYGVGIEMSDAEVASVLTYERSSFGNQSSAVTAEDVARVRATPRTATGSVTAEELRPLM